MNAQGVKDEKHLEQLLQDDSYIAQIKLDGMRAIVHVTSSGLRIFSRSAGVSNPTRPLEKTSSLPHLAALKFPTLEETILDCEILVPGKECAEIAGMVHRKGLNQDNTRVKLFVFDCLQYCGKKFTERPLRERLSQLLLITNTLQSEHIIILPFASTTFQKRKLYEKVKAENGEGIMLKNLNAVYLEGNRPANNWYKAKKSATYDCVVMGFSLGKGKYNSVVGSVKFGQFVDGKLIEIGQASGMRDEDRLMMARFPKKFIGRVVTIKGMERLKSGAVRHPVYAGIRTDKQPADCVWYRGEQ